MAGRKISLDQALQQAKELAERAGLRIEVKVDERFDQPPPVDIVPKKDYTHYGPPKSNLPNLTKLTLYARHTVGSGGHMTMKDGQESVSNNGYRTYGPGVVHVPTALASELAYRDQQAQKADERFLDRRERSYVIGSMTTPQGAQVFRGFEVNDLGEALGNSSFYRGI